MLEGQWMIRAVSCVEYIIKQMVPNDDEKNRGVRTQVVSGCNAVRTGKGSDE